MNRRAHKKSRLGCRECKRRHIKCDEKRPTCAHCAITQRKCQYVSSSTVESTVASPGSTHRSDDTNTPSAAQPRIILRPHDSHFIDELPAPSSSSVPGAAVNMNHMEFLLHYKFSVAIPELDNEFDSAATVMVNKLALKFPWLLHAMLAISARHLAVLRPANSGLYLSEAFQLQNQAISIFNSEQLHINETNCSAALLFSSILGRHMLADTLAALELDGPVLLDNYCHYVQVHRGLRAIASDSWQLLSESEIWPFLLFAGIQRPRKAHGTELEELRCWVQESQGLDDETLKVCLEAVDLLQVGLDEISDATTHIRRYQMAFIWSVCNEARFNDLVMQRLPQALVILAHYAALLHHSKSLWQIRDAGYRFLHMICSVLGPSYDSQLWWVRNLVFGSGTQIEQHNMP